MTALPTPDEAQAAPIPAIERLYEDHYDLLLSLAMSRFGLAATEAEGVLHDVFLSLLIRVNEVRDIRAWLVGAVCNACRSYRRTASRFVALPAERSPVWSHTDRLDAQLVAGQALTALDERSATILRLRFLDGYTVQEIASRLSTTPKYADKLLRKALVLAQGVFEERIAQ